MLRFALPLVLAWAASAAEQGKRVALIIGNDAYATQPLQNAVNDARAMDKSLRGAGFRTFLYENASKAVMEKAVVGFFRQLGPGDTALFFYAGHAVQIENENFLIPVEFESAETVIDAKYKTFSLAQVFDYLKQQRVSRSIVILDACRSNPVTGVDSLQGGLAIPLNPGKETYIAFSTSPSHIAHDNPEGKNSWFTEALADLVSQPGLTLDEVFTRVRMRVERATGGKQTPWSQTSLTEKFYFHAPANLEAAHDPTLAEKWVQDAARHERNANWPEAIDLLNRVVKQDSGAVAQKAKNRLPYLAARNEAASRFEAGDFAAAAAQYERALGIDPFAVDAAMEAASGYLLSDKLPEAVRMLQAVRVRGSSSAVEKAGAVLKELASVYPEAERELKAGVPQPPSIGELFPGARFGIPDWEAGRRYLQGARIDLARWAKDVAPPPPPAPAETPAVAAVPAPEAASPTAAPGPITIHGFHLEVVSLAQSRDLVVSKLETGKINTSGVQRQGGLAFKVTTEPAGMELSVDGDTEQRCASPCVFSLPEGRHSIQVRAAGYRTEMRVAEVARSGETLHVAMEREFGVVALNGEQRDAPVMLDGKAVSAVLPAKLKVPVGKYEVRAVQEGKILTSHEVEVRAGSMVELSFPK